MITYTKYRAKQKGWDFDLDKEWVEERLANGLCEVSNIPFEVTAHSPWRPSIDRKDSSKGYTRDNCRLVVWQFNLAKGDKDDEVVLRLARAITAANPY